VRSERHLTTLDAWRIDNKSGRRAKLADEPERQPALVSRRVVETDFAELKDGTLIEMIEDPNDPANSLFAIYKDGIVRYAGTVECENRVLVPLPRGDEIFKHVRFPRGAKPYQSLQSLQSLLREIDIVIRNCVDLGDDGEALVTLFVLSTWFMERLPVAPYLALVGLPRSGKTTLLELLNLLCRRTLLTADISSAAFYQVYDKLTPTLLVDETLTAGEKRTLFHLLRTGTTRGSVALRKGRSVKAYGPKVISWIELPNDAALNSRCIVIPMQETSRTDLAKPTDRRIMEAADSLRMECLQYRLENYNSLCLRKVDGDEHLYSRTRDLYQALALPVGGDENTCGYLVDVFKRQEEINREPLSPSSAAVLRALYEVIHSHPKDGKCANKELREIVSLFPEGLRLNAHEVGRGLTSLGFMNRKRTNTGYTLWLDLQTRKRIHKLAHDYGIDRESRFSGKGFGGWCELCKNLVAPNPGSAETKGDSGIKSK
jgi:hypothetical protein